MELHNHAFALEHNFVNRFVSFMCVNKEMFNGAYISRHML